MRPVRDPGSSATSSARKPSASRKPASSSEGWGDEASFRRIAESHRREIQLHCYRLVGSLQDAEDLTQDTFLRAWQGITRFEGRTTIRNWLYRIATNVCLTAISKRSIPRRVLPESVAAPTRRMPRGSPADDVPWIEPYPDSELEGLPDSSADPRSRYEMREAVRLAFIAVTQRLPARQRAVLLLRDVLGWSADETAHALEMTLASANSALQRARRTLGKTLSREEIASQALGGTSPRYVAERYATAWENGDLEGLTAVLAKDAAMNMPPWKEWYKGRARIRAFFAYAFDWAWSSPVESFRMVSTRANAEAAFAAYLLVFRDSLQKTRARTSALEIGKILIKWIEWHDSLEAQEKIRFRSAIAPKFRKIGGAFGSSAESVRDEGVEQIVGYLLVNAASFDEATEIARGCPGLEHGFSVEVWRPFFPDGESSDL